MRRSKTSSYFGIGIVNGKHDINLGTLWRGAYQLGAAFIFTVGNRYTPQSSDVTKAHLDIPLRNYPDIDTFWQSIPYSCPIVAIEMGGEPLPDFKHPDRCIYLLGAEDYGLQPSTLARAHMKISLPYARYPSFNVAQAGTIVMYDRFVKRMK